MMHHRRDGALPSSPQSLPQREGNGAKWWGVLGVGNPVRSAPRKLDERFQSHGPIPRQR